MSDPRPGGRFNRGSSATYLALALPAMIGFVAMAVDWGEVAVTRTQVQAAADEGALAAASALAYRPKTPDAVAAAETLGRSRAVQYASQMRVNSIVPMVQPSDVVLGYWAAGRWTTPSSTPNAVSVTASATVHLPFASLIGIPTYTVRASAKAGPNIVKRRAPDLVIVQDVTPSMSSTDIANSRVANVALVDCVHELASGSTRVAFTTFASINKTIQPLGTYDDIYDTLRAQLAGSSAYSSSGLCLGSGGCTSHSAGLAAGVDILNDATEPPDDVGQAIIFVTDGAPYTGGAGCSSTVTGGSSPYQVWLRNECTTITSKTTSSSCGNVGAKWSSGCKASDNGAESTAWAGPGSCSISASLYTTEARCEGNGGEWLQSGSPAHNPSSLTQWTDKQRLRAENGTHRAIDVYAVFYSAKHPTGAYHDDNIKFLTNHVVRGAGADIGVLDAPSGDSLITALEDLCLDYARGDVGLLE